MREWITVGAVVTGVAISPGLLSALDVDAPRRQMGPPSSSEIRQVVDPEVSQALPPDIREMVVRIAGSRIRALCSEGTPEVFILHDEGSSSDAWMPVLRRLDGSVGVCAYDRRGTGESRPAPGPRGWYELLDELRRVHAALGAEGPYVLAGHGVGGLYARVYAADRPRDVAGLVLVEPAHVDLPRRMRPGLPDDVWQAWTDRMGRANRDGVTERSVGQRVTRLPAPRIPVTILTATRRRDGDGWDERFLNEAARQVHESMLRGVAGGRHVPAQGSGPDIHREDPDLVASEIRRIVEAVRRRGS